jgi:hypothetical protein
MASILKRPAVPRPFDRWQWLGLFYFGLAVAVLVIWLAELGGLLATSIDIGGGNVALLLAGIFLLARDPDLPAGTLGRRGWWPLIGLVGLVLLVLRLS